jgi:hypothetical protein
MRSFEIQPEQIRLRMWHDRNKRTALSDRRPGAISKNQDRNDKARRELCFLSTPLLILVLGNHRASELIVDAGAQDVVGEAARPP